MADNFPMKYTSISTHTLAGQKQAESLIAAGWQVYRSGLFMVWLRKAN